MYTLFQALWVVSFTAVCTYEILSNNFYHKNFAIFGSLRNIDSETLMVYARSRNCLPFRITLVLSMFMTGFLWLVFLCIFFLMVLLCCSFCSLCYFDVPSVVFTKDFPLLEFLVLFLFQPNGSMNIEFLFTVQCTISVRH